MTSRKLLLLVAAGTCLATSTGNVLAAEPQGQAPNLRGLVSSALESSDDMGIARSRKQQSQASAKAAASAYFPQINATFKAGRNATYPSSERVEGDPLGMSEYTNASVGKLEVNQMLFDGFRTPSEVQKQKATAQGLEQKERAIGQQVMSDTLEAYLTAWRHMEALRASVALVESLMELNRKVNLQAELGATDKTTQSFVNARLTSARQSLLKTKNAYTEALYRLSYFSRTKLDPHTFAFAELTAPQLGSLEEALAAAHSTNPMIRAEEFDQKASSADLRRVRSSLYPTFSIIADAQDTNDLGGSAGVARSGNLMVQATYKIFDGFASQNEQARIRSEIEEHRLKIQKLTRQLDEDVSQQWRQTNASQQEFNLAAKEHADSLTVRNLRQKDVDDGQGDIVRLIEAEETLYTTTLRMLDLAQDIALKRFELSIATGLLSRPACLDEACPGLVFTPVLPPKPVEQAEPVASPSPTEVLPLQGATPTTSATAGALWDTTLTKIWNGDKAAIAHDESTTMVPLQQNPTGEDDMNAVWGDDAMTPSSVDMQMDELQSDE
jgi:adhesin transport system outer membrane protein